ncbi:unnamed protein product [Coffea canephora]|uniref:Late embryogenesis abundant protein LEA-2 subgroup domain-containing protein n=1 Tax=Coffea canephora TaxID=49390 RepID=A0A068UU68_COFCA|nr:unnamed protein product [Coffea canephora]
MGEKEQAKPLAPASHRIHVEEGAEAQSMETKNYSSRRRCIKCCGISTALILILATTMLVLAFTVFRVKKPVLTMNSVKVEGLDVAMEANFRLGTNVTLVAEVSMKNPNVASFKLDNSTTYLYYGGKMVGEAMTPPGHARARRTMHMNITVDILADQLLDVHRLWSDLQAGALPMGSYTRISGKVNILNIIKKRVVVRMNCTMTVDIHSQSMRDQECKKHVSL